MRKLMAVCTCIFGLASEVGAVEKGMFLDLNAGMSRIENLDKDSLDDDIAAVGIPGGSSIDNNGMTWSATIGYRFNVYLAADLGWISLGEQKYEAEFLSLGLQNHYTATLESRGITLGATGILPIGKKLELRARTGLYFANTAIGRENIGGSVRTVGYTEEDSIEPYIGVSAAYKFTPKFSVYAGAQHFNKVGSGNVVGESDINSVTLGVTFRQ